MERMLGAGCVVKECGGSVNDGVVMYCYRRNDEQTSKKREAERDGDEEMAVSPPSRHLAQFGEGSWRDKISTVGETKPSCCVVYLAVERSQKRLKVCVVIYLGLRSRRGEALSLSPSSLHRSQGDGTKRQGRVK